MNVAEHVRRIRRNGLIKISGAPDLQEIKDFVANNVIAYYTMHHGEDYMIFKFRNTDTAVDAYHLFRNIAPMFSEENSYQFHVTQSIQSCQFYPRLMFYNLNYLFYEQPPQTTHASKIPTQNLCNFVAYLPTQQLIIKSILLINPKNPTHNRMIECNSEYTEQLVKRPHKILRPFILRRYEHSITNQLSKRKRCLYDDFMSLFSTKQTLDSGQFLNVTKVCNHPNLFETRPTITPFLIVNELELKAPLCIFIRDFHLDYSARRPTLQPQGSILTEMALNLPIKYVLKVKPQLIDGIDSSDWGKLQTLEIILKRIHKESHRCLIFTQMTLTLNDMAIKSSQFNTAFFKSNILQDLFKKPSGLEIIRRSSQQFSSIENLESLITCSIHLGMIEEPRQLPCDHAFCYSCLKNYLIHDPESQKRFIVCPLCRFETSIDTQQLDSLSASIIPKQLTEYLILKCQRILDKSLEYDQLSPELLKHFVTLKVSDKYNLIFTYPTNHSVLVLENSSMVQIRVFEFGDFSPMYVAKSSNFREIWVSYPPNGRMAIYDELDEGGAPLSQMSVVVNECFFCYFE